MTVAYQEYQLDWEGMSLLIRWAPVWYGAETFPIAHLEIKSADRSPLPMTETGYRSHFIQREAVEEHGGAVAYVRAWLDHEAQSESWRKHVEERKQLSLF